jgi:hypothetical protein
MVLGQTKSINQGLVSRQTSGRVGCGDGKNGSVPQNLILTLGQGLPVRGARACGRRDRACDGAWGIWSVLLTMVDLEVLQIQE